MCSKLHVDENASLNQYSFCIYLQRRAPPRARAPSLSTDTARKKEPRRSQVDRKVSAADDADSKWPA